MIEASTGRLNLHIPRRCFERDKHAKSGLLSLNGPNKITNIARLDMPRFDLHNDALRLTTGIIHEIDNTVNTSIASLLARFTPLLTTNRLCTHQRQRPPLKLIAIILRKLTCRANVFRLTNDLE